MNDWYIEVYDIYRDARFQCVLPYAEAMAAKAAGASVRERPFEGIQVVSRFHSERRTA